MILKIFNTFAADGGIPLPPVDCSTLCADKCKYNDDYKAGYNDGKRDCEET